jgi:hypothetical protein
MLCTPHLCSRMIRGATVGIVMAFIRVGATAQFLDRLKRYPVQLTLALVVSSILHRARETPFKSLDHP